VSGATVMTSVLAWLRRLVLSPRGSNTLESLSAVHRDELRRFHTELAPILNELTQL
jgi:hypothetical protein